MQKSNKKTNIEDNKRNLKETEEDNLQRKTSRLSS